MLSTLRAGEVFPIDLLLVARDLNARTRLESTGRAVRVVSLEGLAGALAEGPTDAVVLDLDEVGVDGVRVARQAGAERVVAFFSHVDAVAGREAEAAGAEVFPRGRFWRSLEEIFG